MTSTVDHVIAEERGRERDSHPGLARLTADVTVAETISEDETILGTEADVKARLTLILAAAALIADLARLR